MHEHVHLYELPSGTTYSVASTKFRSDFGNVNNHHSVFLCWFFTPIGLFCGSEKLLHDLNCWLCLDRLSQICRFDFAFFFFSHSVDGSVFERPIRAPTVGGEP